MLEQVRSKRRFTWGDLDELKKQTPWLNNRYYLVSSEGHTRGVWWVEGLGLVVGTVRTVSVIDALRMEPTDRVMLVYNPISGAFRELQIESRDEAYAKSLIPTDADDE
jgi:hypothetical protein